MTLFHPPRRGSPRIFRSFSSTRQGVWAPAAPGTVKAMNVLVTGATGFVGSALIPRLERDGNEVVAFARSRDRVRAAVPVIEGDAITGTGLDEALAGVDVAYFLIHSMEPPTAAN